MAQLKNYKKKIKESKKAELPTLSDLRVWLENALKIVKNYDSQMKQTPDPEQWEKLLS